MSDALELPDIGEPSCGLVAINRADGRRIACVLKLGHASPTCWWERLRYGVLESAAWYPDPSGHPTCIGERQETPC